MVEFLLPGMAKVFIVEDEEILAKVLQEKFREAGLEVEVAHDGEMAYPLAKDYHPDVVVLDLILPKRDGFQVLEQLKADKELAKVPVMILSNLGQDEEIKRGLALGAVDYFVKTQHSIKEVVSHVKEYLGKKK